MASEALTVRQPDAASPARARVAITCGEPAGIGPEIALRAAQQTRDIAHCLLLGDAAQLKSIASRVTPSVRLHELTSAAQFAATLHEPVSTQSPIFMLDCPLAVAAVAGTLDARNGAAVLQTLDAAIAAALQRHVQAVVTAPVQKSTINEAGIAFSGHTEYFAEKTGTVRVVMMLAGAVSQSVDQSALPKHTLRVALATTHLALKDVPAAITIGSLTETLAILHHDLQSRFGIAQPRILVTGLNPHAGEGGYLGREEIEVINPVLQQAQARGWHVRGPYPADTLFQPKYLHDADCVLAMYHDQGLPVLKYASFGHGVNITLGLPLIRTSVDHGTALDLAAAGLGQADCSSMVEAIRVACQMASH